MLNTALFRPFNFLVIAFVTLLWMFLLAKGKQALDGN